MSLKEIFCQDKAISVLQRGFAADKMPHAYIFAGAEGVGKFKTAREWAKLLLCKNPATENGFADSCGLCQSCRLFEAGSHPDFNLIYKELLEFTKDNKDKTTPLDLAIDVIREFLIDKVSTRPTLSQRRVFIISEAERLNASSQNAMLKVLEEPPAYCTIVLLCTRMERLLPTTKSRCRIIRFSHIDQERIINQLKAMGLNGEKAQYFARLAQGSLGQGCQWAQLELADANLYQIKKELLNSLSTYKLADCLDLAERLLDKAKKIAAAWGELDEDHQQNRYKSQGTENSYPNNHIGFARCNETKHCRAAKFHQFRPEGANKKHSQSLQPRAVSRKNRRCLQNDALD